MNAQLSLPRGIIVDDTGNLYIADWSGNRVRKVDTFGIITTVAGTGTATYNGDNISATSANLSPVRVIFNKNRELIVTDNYNNRIRKVDANGIIHTIAGNGILAFAGDGGPADSASLNGPSGITFDTCGNLYITEVNKGRIRKVAFNPNCSITDTTTVDTTDTTTTVLNVIPNDNDVHIYPNPAKENVTVSYNGNAAEISIMNTLGQTLMKEKSSGHKVVLNVSGLREGVYFIMVKDEQGSTARIKFLKE